MLTTDTKIIKIDTSAEMKGILDACHYLEKDELVAFPTETVYGLGGNGLSQKACEKIFKTKGRPADNPLILHISEKYDLYSLVKEIPEEGQRLMENLWPGPLTLIFKGREFIPKAVTAGGDTVAVRMPSHPIALSLLEEFEKPIAAPSANISGRPSPTKASDVYEDLKGKIPLILDGGESRIGIESTVLDLTEKPFKILRPGFFDAEDIKPFAGEVEYDPGILVDGIVPKSPGQKYKHYAPKAEVYCVRGSKNKRMERIFERLLYWKKLGYRTGVLAFEENIKNINGDEKLSLGSEKDLITMAHVLFQHLREMDRRGVEVVLVEGTVEKGLGIGIMNRLRKSCKGRVEDL